MFQVAGDIAVFARKRNRQHERLIKWGKCFDPDASTVARPRKLPVLVRSTGAHRADQGGGQANCPATGQPNNEARFAARAEVTR